MTRETLSRLWQEDKLTEQCSIKRLDYRRAETINYVALG